MSATAPLRTNGARPAPAAGTNRVLQRKCACGAGASGLTGECEECSKKKMMGLQTKLRINEPGDAYEREADRVAGHVMTRPVHPGVSNAPLAIQRFSGSPAGSAVATPASVGRALAAPGRPLDPLLRQDMEQRFGHDFSRVRVHSDAAAAHSARDINAHAYTVGRSIVFGAGQFAPSTQEGQRLLAHELTHVVQQAGGTAAFAQRKENDQHEWTTIVQVTVESNATGEGRATGITASRETIPLEVEVNNLSVGRHDMEGLSADPDFESWSRVHVKSLTANLFVYLVPPGVTVAPRITVVVKPKRRNVRQEVRALRKSVQDYLMPGSGPPASNEVLENVLRVGRALEAAGITDEELLLLKYAENGVKRPFDETVEDYLEQREIEQVEAQDTRDELVTYGNLLASLSSFPYPLPPLASLQNLLPGPLEVLDRQLSEDSRFRGVTHLRETLNLFANAFDKELFGLAMGVLNGVEVGLIKMQARFVGQIPDRKASPANLVAEINKIKANPKVIAALESLRKEREVEPDVLEQAAEIVTTGTASRDQTIERLERNVDEAVSGGGSILKMLSGTSVGLLEAKSGEEAQRKLIDFILDGRATVRRAKAALDLDNPASLYWDKIVSAQKTRMGIQSGSKMDWIVDEIVNAGKSATSFWDKVWSILQVVMMFLPGPLGVALRTVAAVVDVDKSIADYRRKLDAFDTGLSSQQPSLSALYTQIVFTAGGVALDVGMTRLGPKPAATSGSRTAVRAGDDIAEQQAAKELRAGSEQAADEALHATGAGKPAVQAADDAARITEDAADRLTKSSYHGGGHEFKVLKNGRVVRCSPFCGDADEMLMEVYEDVLLANRHLIPEIDDLGRLIRTDPDKAAKVAADLEKKLSRLRGTERGHGAVVGRAEDIGGKLHPTTRSRAGIPGDEGKVAREELRRNLGGRPGGVGEYQAHHIVPFELREHPLVYQMRVRFGWNINGRTNGIWLPTREGIVDAAGATVHRGSHLRYTLWVESRLDDVAARYKSGAISDNQLLREFEDVIGEFENGLRSSSFGRPEPGGGVVLR